MTSDPLRRTVKRVVGPTGWARLNRVNKTRRRVERLAAMSGAVVLTSVFPRAIDRPIAALIARGFVLLRPKRVHKTSRRMAKTLGGAPADWSDSAGEYWRMRVEVRWARARGAGLQAGFPRFTVQGGEHLEAARSQARGVVLWRIPFTMPTPLNASVQQAGFRLVHLTSRLHMVDDSGRLSMRVIGPLNTVDEARFIDLRVTRSKSGSGPYLKALSDELSKGSAVSIVGLSTLGRASVPATVGRIRVRLPTGAPSLAFSTGAALIPCTAVRTGPFRWKVVFLAPIEPEPGQNRRSFRVEACHRFAAHTEDLARAEPASASFWGRTD